VKKLLPVMRGNWGPYDPRPHWGSCLLCRPRPLRAKFEKLNEFICAVG